MAGREGERWDGSLGWEHDSWDTYFYTGEIKLKGRSQCRGELDIEERKGIINGDNLLVIIKIMAIIIY